MNDQSRWQALGEYYGYPQCCIDNFIHRCELIDNGEDDDMDGNQEKVHNHQGFVPCPSCAKKIVSGEVTIQGLIKNRKAAKPFPKSTRNEAINYIHNITAKS